MGKRKKFSSDYLNSLLRNLPAPNILSNNNLQQPAAPLYGVPPAAAAAAPINPSGASGSKLTVNTQRIEEVSDDDFGDGLEDVHYATVTTDAFEELGLNRHPSPVAEAAALSSVKLPEVKYALTLPGHVLRNISAVQFQAVQLACARHEVRLENGCRGGFFLGDGPGVGKGRQISAVILNYFCRGKTKAVWVSVSGDLVVDAERDLGDVGALDYEPVRLHDLRQLKVKKGQSLDSLPGLDQGILFCTYDLLISGAKKIKRQSKGNGGNKKPWGKENVPPGGAGAGPGAAGSSSGLAAGLLQGKQPLATVDGQLVQPWAEAPAMLHELEEEEEEEEFGPESRLLQIVDWLGDGDYAVVFDECHRAKNCVVQEQLRQVNQFALAKDQDEEPTTSKQSTGNSKTARAVMELQARLPNARFLYVSASGATEVDNLGYMERLGLWGPGTAFSCKEAFVSSLKSRGMAGMEMTAMELKARGCYISRMLSYEGVEFIQKHVEVSPEFQVMYDAGAQLWQDVRALAKDATLPKGGMRSFYAAQMRFFRQLCTAAKVDAVVELCLDYEARGYAPVVGLQSTGEARTAAFVAQHGEDEAFESFVEPAALVLSNWIETWLAGQPGAEQLLERAHNLQLPKNPLDDLIHRLGGPDAVAEMTGRQKRLLQQPDGTFVYGRRADEAETQPDKVNLLERARFQRGERRFAIISDAASAGVSLHADNSAPNTRRRVHITLELAWSADKTVQQLGRTHRSNQRQPPLYIILSSNISGEWRFASAVARRLEQLGALTQGDRRAASSASALAQYNLQNKWARHGLKNFYDVLKPQFITRQEPNFTVSPPWLAEEMAVRVLPGTPQPEPNTPEWLALKEQALNGWLPRAYNCLNAVGLFDAKTKNYDPHKLLNRLLAVGVEMQGQIFQYFTAFMDNEVATAKRNRTYTESGIIKPRCESITLKQRQVLYTDPNDSAVVELLTFDTDRGVSWEKATALLEEERERVREEEGEEGVRLSDAGFYTSELGSLQPLLALPRSEKGLRPAGKKGRGRVKQAYYMRIIRPDTGFNAHDIAPADFRKKYTKLAGTGICKRAWEAGYQDRNRNQRSASVNTLHLLSGCLLRLLPIIADTLRKAPMTKGTRQLRLVRVETSDDNQRYIGAEIPYSAADTMITAIKEHAAATTAAAAAAAAAAGAGAVAGASGGKDAAATAAAAAKQKPVASADAVRQAEQELAAATGGAVAAAEGAAGPQQQQQDQDKAAEGDAGDLGLSSSSDGGEGSDSEAEVAQRKRRAAARRRRYKRDKYRQLLQEMEQDAAFKQLARQEKRAALEQEVQLKLQSSGLWLDSSAALSMRPKAAEQRARQEVRATVWRNKTAERRQQQRQHIKQMVLEGSSAAEALTSSSTGSGSEEVEGPEPRQKKSRRSGGRARAAGGEAKEALGQLQLQWPVGVQRLRKLRLPASAAAAAAAGSRALAAIRALEDDPAAAAGAGDDGEAGPGLVVSSRGRRRRPKSLGNDFVAHYDLKPGSAAAQAASADEEASQGAAAADSDSAVDSLRGSDSEYIAESDADTAPGDGAGDAGAYEVLDLMSDGEVAPGQHRRNSSSAAAAGGAGAGADATAGAGGADADAAGPSSSRKGSRAEDSSRGSSKRHASGAEQPEAKKGKKGKKDKRRKKRPQWLQDLIDQGEAFESSSSEGSSSDSDGEQEGAAAGKRPADKQPNGPAKQQLRRSRAEREKAAAGEGKPVCFEEELRAAAHKLLKRSDLSVISVKSVRLQLQQQLGRDLAPWKQIIKEVCHAHVDALQKKLAAAAAAAPAAAAVGAGHAAAMVTGAAAAGAGSLEVPMEVDEAPAPAAASPVAPASAAAAAGAVPPAGVTSGAAAAAAGQMPTTEELTAAIQEYLSGLASFAGVKKKTVEKVMEERFAADLKPMRTVLKDAVDSWVKARALAGASAGQTTSGVSEVSGQAGAGGSNSSPAAPSPACQPAPSTAAAAAAVACSAAAGAAEAGSGSSTQHADAAATAGAAAPADASADAPATAATASQPDGSCGGSGSRSRKRRVLFEDSEEEEREQQHQLGDQQGVTGGASPADNTNSNTAGVTAAGATTAAPDGAAGPRASTDDAMRSSKAARLAAGAASPAAAAAAAVSAAAATDDVLEAAGAEEVLAASATAAAPVAVPAVSPSPVQVEAPASPPSPPPPAAAAPCSPLAAASPPPAAEAAVPTDLDGLIAAKVASALAALQQQTEARLQQELAAQRAAFEAEKRQLELERQQLLARMQQMVSRQPSGATQDTGGGAGASQQVQSAAAASATPAAAAASAAAGSAASQAAAATAAGAAALMQQTAESAPAPSAAADCPGAEQAAAAPPPAASACAGSPHAKEVARWSGGSSGELPTTADAAPHGGAKTPGCFAVPSLPGAAVGAQAAVLLAPMGDSPGALITPMPALSQRSQLGDYTPVVKPHAVKPIPLPEPLDGPELPDNSDTLTADSVRAWLEERPGGATAPLLLKQFSCAAGSSREVVLQQVLQQLVDDLEVMRMGKAAARSALVDLADSTTVYCMI